MHSCFIHFVHSYRCAMVIHEVSAKYVLHLEQKYNIK